MQTTSELKEELNTGVDDIARQFIKHYSLTYNQEVAHLEDPLLRWLDFVVRYIVPKPRAIHYSNRFPIGNLNKKTRQALARLKELIKKGEDVNPYQSHTLLRHDTSGTKAARRTDMLLASWSISHFHLAVDPLKSRAEWLLFCIVLDNTIGFIDIRHHDEKDLFSDITIVETMLRSWPMLAQQCKLNGIPSLALSSSDISNLWKKGINAPICLGDNAYFPGYGLTTARTSCVVTDISNKIRHSIMDLAKRVLSADSQFQIDANNAGINDPEFDLRLINDNVAIYERKQNKAYLIKGCVLFDNFLVPLWARGIS